MNKYCWRRIVEVSILISALLIIRRGRTISTLTLAKVFSGYRINVIETMGKFWRLNWDSVKDLLGLVAYLGQLQRNTITRKNRRVVFKETHKISEPRLRRSLWVTDDNFLSFRFCFYHEWKFLLVVVRQRCIVVDTRLNGYKSDYVEYGDVCVWFTVNGIWLAGVSKENIVGVCRYNLNPLYKQKKAKALEYTCCYFESSFLLWVGICSNVIRKLLKNNLNNFQIGKKP